MLRLHDYQRRAAMFIAAHSSSVLSVDMGLGKTASVLAYLEASQPQRVLIVAPKRVALTVWKQEAEKWQFACADRMAIVAGTPAKRHKAIEQHEWLVVSRDNLSDVKNTTYDVVVLDELTTFKTPTSKRFKALQTITAQRWVGLTGTIVANGAIDLYGQFAAVRLPVGNYYAWRGTFFKDVMKGSGQPFSKWRLRVPLAEVLKDVNENLFTLTAEDYLAIPEVTYFEHVIDLPKKQKDEYMRLSAMLALEIDGELHTVSERARFAKLQTLADGFIYEEREGGERIAIRGWEDKLLAVSDYVRQCVAEGERVLLFYAYVEEREWLKELLTDVGNVVDVGNNATAVEEWNVGNVDVLLAHPASAGHGLNLQSGGRLIVWSSLTYNYEYWAQANARLARQGQRRAVQVHVFTAADTIEVAQYAALKRKEKEQQQYRQLTR